MSHQSFYRPYFDAKEQAEYELQVNKRTKYSY